MGLQHDLVWDGPQQYNVQQRPHVTQFDEPPSYLDTINRENSEQPPNDPLLDEAFRFTQPTTIPTYYQRLRQPIAIPQVASGLGMPFARAYAPILQERGIPMASFIELLDNYNVVSASSPPLQVLGMAAGMVGMIPFHYAQLVSMGLQLATTAGNVAISKTRGTMFLKKVNQDFFAPRGLKMELVTGEALLYKLGLHPDTPLSVPFNQAGNMSMHERKTEALAGNIAALTYNVPAPTEQSNLLNKLSAGAQKHNIAMQEKKDMKKQQKRAEKMGGEGGLTERTREKLDKEERKRDEEIAKIQAETEKKLRKKPRDYQKIVEEGDREISKVVREAEKELRKIEGKGHKDEGHDKKDKEEKKAKKMLWIFIDDLRE